MEHFLSVFQQTIDDPSFGPSLEALVMGSVSNSVNRLAEILQRAVGYLIEMESKLCAMTQEGVTSKASAGHPNASLSSSQNKHLLVETAADSSWEQDTCGDLEDTYGESREAELDLEKEFDLMEKEYDYLDRDFGAPAVVCLENFHLRPREVVITRLKPSPANKRSQGTREVERELGLGELVLGEPQDNPPPHHRPACDLSETRGVPVSSLPHPS